jgi:hypothetical protein
MREEQRRNPSPCVEKLMKIKAAKEALKKTDDTPVPNG